MIRTSLSGFLAFLTLSFVYAPLATANSIDFADRHVHGVLSTPVTGQSTPQNQTTFDTFGTFDAHVGDFATEGGASAAYQAHQVSSISEFMMAATGSAFGSIATTNPGDTLAFAESYFSVQFTLDGNYNYEFSGSVSAANTGSGSSATAKLTSFTEGTLHNFFTNNGLVNFSDSGTLGDGSYELFLEAGSFQHNGGVLEGNAAFNAIFTLTPTAVPDGGDTAILFLLGSAFLSAFALRERRLSS